MAHWLSSLSPIGQWLIVSKRLGTQVLCGFENWTFYAIQVNFKTSLTSNTKGVSYDQFVMEEWQTIRRLFGVKIYMQANGSNTISKYS